MAWMSGVAVGGVGVTKPGGGVAVGKGVGVDVDTAAAVGVGSGEAQAVSSPTNMNATVSRSKRIGVNARRSGRGEQRRETLAAGAVAPRQVCHELYSRARLALACSVHPRRRLPRRCSVTKLPGVLPHPQQIAVTVLDFTGACSAKLNAS